MNDRAYQLYQSTNSRIQSSNSSTKYFAVSLSSDTDDPEVPLRWYVMCRAADQLAVPRVNTSQLLPPSPVPPARPGSVESVSWRGKTSCNRQEIG